MLFNPASNSPAWLSRFDFRRRLISRKAASNRAYRLSKTSKFCQSSSIVRATHKRPPFQDIKIFPVEVGTSHKCPPCMSKNLTCDRWDTNIFAVKNLYLEPFINPISNASPVRLFVRMSLKGKMITEHKSLIVLAIHYEHILESFINI